MLALPETGEAPGQDFQVLQIAESLFDAAVLVDLAGCISVTGLPYPVQILHPYHKYVERKSWLCRSIFAPDHHAVPRKIAYYLADIG